MSGDEKFVRNWWRKIRTWRQRRALKQKVASEATAVGANSSSGRFVPESAVLEAYAKGYQDGWGAGLHSRQDSAAASCSGGGAVTPTSVKESKANALTPSQLEDRGFKAGWNRAWEVVKKDGWTKGCVHCSQHLRHSNVVRRTSGVSAGRGVHHVPNMPTVRPNNGLSKAWSTTAVPRCRRQAGLSRVTTGGTSRTTAIRSIDESRHPTDSGIAGPSARVSSIPSRYVYTENSVARSRYR